MKTHLFPILILLILLQPTGNNVKAQTPFTCGNLLFEVSGTSTTSTLNSIKVSTGVATLLASYSVQTNALAYNSFDNLLWGVQNGNQLVRIDASGTVYPVTTVTGLTLSGPNTGTISSAGYYYVTAGATLAGGYYTINVNPASADYLKIVNPSTLSPIAAAPYTTSVSYPSGVASAQIADWAYNNSDGFIWTLSNQTPGLTPVNNAKLFKMNPATGAITLATPALSPLLGNLGAFGTVIIDATGFLFAKRNSNGDIYQINMVTGVNTIASSTGTATDFNDGAACFSALVLPLSLLDFNLTKNDYTAQLKWTTTADKNKGFYIMHSLDGAGWEELGFVPCNISGNILPQSYNFSHTPTSEGRNYYKLKLIGLDEKITMSNTESILFGQSDEWTVSPNPADGFVKIYGLKSGTVINVLNAMGKIVLSQTSSHENEILSTENLNKGIYFISCNDPATGNNRTVKILKD